MKTKKIITFGVLLLTMSLGFGCKKEEKPAAAATGGGGGSVDTGLATSAFIGSYEGTCTAMPANGAGLGSTFNGGSYVHLLSSGTDGTVSMSTLVFTGTVCQFGGTQLLNISQTLTATNQGLATSPAGATEFLFTVTGMTMTVYTGNPLATTINNACLTTGFNTGATSTVSMLGRDCVSSPGTIANFTFPATNDALYNIVTKSGTTLTTGVPGNFIFNIGQYGSYPTSVSRILVD